MGSTDPGGAVVAGDQIRGVLQYEVPIGKAAYTMQFQSDLFGNSIAQWEVTT
jgi:hypothetical protein